MSLSTIKALQDEVASLTQSVSELSTRKSKIVSEPVGALSKSVATRASSLFLLSRVRGIAAGEVKGFDDVKDYETRAIAPADVSGWLAEEFSKDILERMTLLANVEGLFPNYTIPANVESLSIPQKTGKTKAYLIAPSQEAIQSAITAAKVTFSAKRLITLSAISDQASDETVVALIEVIKQDIAESLVNAMENALINGDTDATAGNINGATVGGSATDALKTFDGLRKITMDNDNKVDFSGALTYANLLVLRRKMGKDGINQNDLTYIVSPSAFHKLVALPEVMTVDKYGAAATVITGEVAKIGAIPVLVSEFVPEDLSATGIYDAVGDKTVILLVNRKMFAVADRGNAGFEQDRSITSTTNMYVGYRDVDFNALLPQASVSALGFNVATV